MVTVSDLVLVSDWGPSLSDFWPGKLPDSIFQNCFKKSIIWFWLCHALWMKHSVVCTEVYDRYRFLILNLSLRVRNSELTKHELQSLLINCSWWRETVKTSHYTCQLGWSVLVNVEFSISPAWVSLESPPHCNLSVKASIWGSLNEAPFNSAKKYVSEH